MKRRDNAHFKTWRVLTLAGGEPKEELDLLRELFPTSHVTMVDYEEKCCDAARKAGADEVFCCDLSDPPAELLKASFDVVNLDLCTNDVKGICLSLVSRYAEVVAPAKGGLMLTFQVGRDPPAYDPGPYKGIRHTVMPRVRYLDQVREDLHLTQVLPYQSGSPMCALMWWHFDIVKPVSIAVPSDAVRPAPFFFDIGKPKGDYRTLQNQVRRSFISKSASITLHYEKISKTRRSVVKTSKPRTSNRRVLQFKLVEPVYVKCISNESYTTESLINTFIALGGLDVRKIDDWIVEEDPAYPDDVLLFATRWYCDVDQRTIYTGSIGSDDLASQLGCDNDPETRQLAYIRAVLHDYVYYNEFEISYSSKQAFKEEIFKSPSKRCPTPAQPHSLMNELVKYSKSSVSLYRSGRYFRKGSKPLEWWQSSKEGQAWLNGVLSDLQTR